MGCFGDDRDLGMTALVSDGNRRMTVEFCSILCKHQGYSYAGLQAG